MREEREERETAGGGGPEAVDWKELEAAAESVLFASGEPVRIDRICVALEVDRETAERALLRLRDGYAYERRGIRLVRMEDAWQLCSAPEYAGAVRKAFEIRKTAKLSQPALEALTIIAYYQPVTRAYVDKLRGVDSAYTVSLLLDRGLIEECGHLQAPGRPRLYRTTRKFLRSFHLSSLDDLPELPETGMEGQLRLNEDGVPEGGGLLADAEAEDGARTRGGGADAVDVDTGAAAGPGGPAGPDAAVGPVLDGGSGAGGGIRPVPGSDSAAASAGETAEETEEETGAGTGT